MTPAEAFQAALVEMGRTIADAIDRALVDIDGAVRRQQESEAARRGEVVCGANHEGLDGGACPRCRAVV